MPDESRSRVAVLGGTGFLGRRVVEALEARDTPVTVAARRPESHAAPGRRTVEADIRDAGAVTEALRDADAAINCVSLYRERGDATFDGVHVDAAGLAAGTAASLGLRRFVHVSGIGADPDARSAYIRARGRGEEAVRAAFPQSVIVRPGAMFSRDEGFIAALGDAVRDTPVFPLFGRGDTRLQPVFVEDVAEAIARLATTTDPVPQTFELGGSETYTFRELVERLAGRQARNPVLIPVPFALWRAAAFAMRPLPNPPVTPFQVALMRQDNVAHADAAGFGDLGIEARSPAELGLL